MTQADESAPGGLHPNPDRPRLEISYLPVAEFASFRAAATAHLLGVVAHGLPEFRTAAAPLARVDTPQLGNEPLLELWRSSAPVTAGEAGGIHHASDGELLFGTLHLDAHPEEPGAAAHTAYARIAELCTALGYPHLVRCWNYFPCINREVPGGLERYQEFCAGRFEALRAATGALPEPLPAASALGSMAGGLSVHFLAAKTAGRALENPRQMSAFRYPACYGPRSPSFSRAQLLQLGDGGDALFISGTASIVSHESRHPADPAGQLRETERNLRTLLELAAEQAGVALTPKLFKVYLRNPRDYTRVHEQFASELGRGVPTLYLKADICRKELLLEIDAYASA